MKKLLLPSLSFLLALTIQSCSTTAPAPEAKKAKAPEAPPEPVSGQKAFFQMYAAARSWAADLQPFDMTSVSLQSVKSADGKYGAWRCTFVSDSKRSQKTYTYSVIEGEGLYKGVYGAVEDNYAGPRGQNAPFIIQAFKTDSDKAFALALEHGGKKHSEKFPDLPITMRLESVKRYPNPVWRVMWGASPATSNFSVYVNAATGAYLETTR